MDIFNFRKLKISIFLEAKLRSKDLKIIENQVFWPEFGLQKYGHLQFPDLYPFYRAFQCYIVSFETYFPPRTLQVRKLKMSIFLGSKLRSKDLIFNDFQVFWPEFGLQKYGYLRNWRYPYFWRPNSGQKSWKSLKIKFFDRSLDPKNMDIFNFLTCTVNHHVSFNAKPMWQEKNAIAHLGTFPLCHLWKIKLFVTCLGTTAFGMKWQTLQWLKHVSMHVQLNAIM